MIEQMVQQAMSLAEQGEPDEALRVASQILNENPNEARALFIASYVFLQAERYGMAYNLLKQAGLLVPQRDEVWNNLGMCAMKIGFIKEAREYLNKALRINPKSNAAMNNLALIEVNECNPIKALEWVNKSLKLNPDQWDVKETSGYANLMLGNWTEGWDGFEAMVGNTKQRTAEPRKPVPYWGGEPYKKLLIRGEQGLGDEIVFASMLNDVKTDVVLECDRRLETLFKRSFPNIEIHGTRFDKSVDWDSDYEAWCLIGSLGWHYRYKDEHFTGNPYLKADPDKVKQVKERLNTLGNRPKIGIAWNGGLKDTFKDRRSVTLKQLQPLLAMDCDFISLEYKTPDLEGFNIHHWPELVESKDYDDTASLVESLDLVISVTTAAVDLCGALGKECWVLVPSKPHWRFGLEGTKNNWYQSVKHYRQKGSWENTIKQLGSDLEAYLHRRGC
jgi:tetratricopeptide (TPR) repeat protein